jgi:hypothetical protein
VRVGTRGSAVISHLLGHQNGRDRRDGGPDLLRGAEVFVTKYGAAREFVGSRKWPQVRHAHTNSRTQANDRVVGFGASVQRLPRNARRPGRGVQVPACLLSASAHQSLHLPRPIGRSRSLLRCCTAAARRLRCPRGDRPGRWKSSFPWLSEHCPSPTLRSASEGNFLSTVCMEAGLRHARRGSRWLHGLPLHASN